VVALPAGQLNALPFRLAWQLQGLALRKSVAEAGEGETEPPLVDRPGGDVFGGAGKHLAQLLKAELPCHLPVSLAHLAPPGRDGFGDGQAQVLVGRSETGTGGEGLVVPATVEVVAAWGYVEGGHTALDASLDQPAVQTAAGVQGHGVALRQQGFDRRAQGVSQAEALRDPSSSGQPLTLVAELRLLFQGKHRPLPLGADEASQVALAATPVQHRGVAGTDRSGEGIDLRPLAAGDVRGEVGTQLHEPNLRQARQRGENVQLGQGWPMVAQQVVEGRVVAREVGQIRFAEGKQPFSQLREPFSPPGAWFLVWLRSPEPGMLFEQGVEAVETMTVIHGVVEQPALPRAGPFGVGGR